MKKYIVALDQGTTSSRAIVFDRAQNIVAQAQKEFPQIYPQAGWVEHDPMELYSCQYGVMMEAVTRSGISVQEIAAIGITNQRETTVVWEKDTGRRSCATVCAPPGWSLISSRRPASSSTPISPRRKSAGFSTMSPAHRNAPSAASCCSARWTAGFSGS